MKPNNYDLRQLKAMDERLTRYKEAQFIANGLDASLGFFLWILACALFPPLILAWFLWEWWTKFLRMTKIFFQILIMNIMRFNYTKLLLVMVFIFMVLFILANILK